MRRADGVMAVIDQIEISGEFFRDNAMQP